MTDHTRKIGVKNDLMIFLIVPKCRRVDEGLSIYRSGEMTDFSGLQKSANPGIVFSQMRSALKGSWVLSDIVSRHIEIPIDYLQGGRYTNTTGQ